MEEDTRELLNTIFVWCIQKAGPTFIKIVNGHQLDQIYFLPKPVKCCVLTYREVRTVSNVKKMIEDSIGLPINEILMI